MILKAQPERDRLTFDRGRRPRRHWLQRVGRLVRRDGRIDGLFVTCLLALMLGGCATLREERDALARYESTRSELERASRGELRPSFEDGKVTKKAPLQLSDLEPANWKTTFRRLTGRGPAPEQAERTFQQAQAEYQEAVQLRDQNPSEPSSTKFLAAADKFDDAAQQLPKSSLEQNALFYAGEAYFFADRYVKANDAYERLLKNYPNSRYIDDIQRRRFAIAEYWLDLYRKEKPQFYEVNLTDSTKPWNSLFSNSMRVFDRIRLDDPTGKLADDATLALANAHFAEGSYTKADEYYTDLRKTFPSSEHQFTAHFVGLKAKVLTYQGPDYGGTVLDECEKLIQTIRKQFPAEAEKEREYLARSLAEVRYRKAEREYLMAQYYETKAEYGAAKHYYGVITKEFSDTPFFEKTKERLAAIGGYPDTPNQRFEWLVKAFPREENLRPLIATDKPKTKKR